MRENLLNPISNTKRQDAVSLAQELYRLHESGRDYTQELTRFAAAVGKSVSKVDVDAAFGSVAAPTFAEGLLADPGSIPMDLTDEEMLELIERICEAKGSEFQIGHWIRCLKRNTGDERVSDLIFWPGEYFGDGNNRREMSPREMLDTAIAAGRKARS